MEKILATYIINELLSEKINCDLKQVVLENKHMVTIFG